MIKTIGSSKAPKEIKQLYKEGEVYIKTYQGQQILHIPEQGFKEAVRNSIKSITIEGINLLLGTIYSAIGFDKVKSELLKQLVLVRLSHPASKLKTTQYLKRFFIGYQ